MSSPRSRPGRAPARAAWLVLGALVFPSAGCPKAPEDHRDQVASAADLTTRQLIAALNAKSKEALAPLVVLTSTTGGAPRPIRTDELQRVILPDGPFEYLGAGKPGEMLLLDGTKARHAAKLIELGGAMKVLATNEPLSAYLARETGQPMAAPEETQVRVISVLRKAD